MKKLLLLAALIQAVITGSAQPPVTMLEDFAAGDQFRMVNCRDTQRTPGAAGAAQIWDFSSLAPVDTTTTFIMAASAAPGGAQYPAANLVYKDRPGSWTYIAKHGARSSIVGIIDSNTIGTGMTAMQGRKYGYDSMLFARRPLQYGDVLLDTFTSSISNLAGISPAQGGGNIKVAVDGWGTLRLPGATYNNVIRIRQDVYELDSIITLTRNFLLSARTSYFWYSDAVKNPLLTISTYTLTGTSSANSRKTIAYYLNPNANLSAGQLQQEPAAISGTWSNDRLLLYGGFADNRTYHVIITSLSSARLLTAALPAQNGVIGIDPGATLTPGLYFVRITDARSGQAFKALKVLKDR